MSGLRRADKLKLTNGRIMSILMYASTVWGGGAGTVVDKLQRVHYKTARWVLSVSRTSVHKLMQDCNWLSMEQNMKYEVWSHSGEYSD